MPLSISQMLVFGSLLTSFYYAVNIQHWLVGDAPLHKYFGPYAPFQPLAPYLAVEECRLTQVNVLQRHGARYPTSGFLYRIERALAHLKEATEYKDPTWKFLHTYKCHLGKDDLINEGHRQSSAAGVEAAQRYISLFNQNHCPFVRASSALRVVDSANSWIKGCQAIMTNCSMSDMVIIHDGLDMNDTLSNHACRNADYKRQQAKLEEWLRNYGQEIADRVNRIATGARVQSIDVVPLMALCPLEVAAFGSSPFCQLFSLEDWKAFSYFWDLEKYYGFGHGQQLGAVQGVGWVTELLSRLTGTRVTDNTQTNHTLNDSPVTFPLDRTFYVDLSHDNEMLAIFAAIGLFRAEPALDDRKRTWSVSQITPFASRFVVERYECKKMAYVRLLINDRVIKELDGMEKSGLMSLAAFIDSQHFARHQGQRDWHRCRN